MTRNRTDFATFTPALFRDAGVHPYLSLLSMYDEPESRAAMSVVRAAVQNSPDVEQEVEVLLGELNWRPNLVGGVAILSRALTTQTLNALWRALDRASWVSPQLAVTAYLCDPSFENRARSRIESGCPIHYDSSDAMDALKPFRSHSGKTLAVLVYLCQQSDAARSWLPDALNKEHIQSVLSEEYDGGETIAASWLEKARSLLETG